MEGFKPALIASEISTEKTVQMEEDELSKG
jgi:hypothetical protein